MLPPTTTYDEGGFNVKISWTVPYTHLTKPVTKYNIIIRDSTGVYKPHPSCDAT